MREVVTNKYWEIKRQLALLYEKKSAPGWSASAAATG